MRSLTVVIVPDDKCGRAVMDVAARWSRQGLLREAVWLTTAEADIPDHGPPDVRATMLGNSDAASTDLFTLIAVRNLDLVRVIMVQQLLAGCPADPAGVVIGRRIADLVSTRLPRSVTAENRSGTRLVRINLLVPESGVRGLTSDLLVADWEMNALASPEDRPDLGHASLFVRAGVNFDAHAVAATACVGGLWRGVDEGAFDDVEVDSATGASDLIVFRPNARILLGDNLSRSLADRAMELAQDSTGNGPARYLAWATPAESPDHRVAVAMTELATHGDWARDLLREMPELPKTELSLRGAVADLARFQLQLLASAGRLISNTATRWVEDRVTDFTAGSDGQYVARVVPRSPDEVEQIAQQRLDRQTSSLDSELLRREVDKTQPPSPSTWVELRALCFGLLDGSPLPEGFTTPERAGLRELLPPKALVPAPDDHFLAEGGTVLRPVDIDAAASLRARIAESNQIPPPAAADDAAQPPSSPALPEAGQSAGAALDNWVALRQNTLFWQLARTVWSRRQAAADSEASAYARATDAAAPDVEAVRRSRRRLLKCWGSIAILTVSGLAWAGIEHWFRAGLSFEEMWKGASTVTLLLVLLALYGGWQYYRALSRFERQVQHKIAERLHAGERFLVAAREARRLNLLYAGVQDWAEVIGWVVHRPWSPNTESPNQEDADAAELPAAVALGKPAAGSSELPDDLVHDAIGLLCSKGWMRGLFDELVTTDVTERHWKAANRGHLPADLDTGLTGQGSRAQLRVLVASTAARSELARSARQLVDEKVTDRTLNLPPREVVRLGDYASPDPISDDAFFRGSLGAATPFVDELWTPAGMQSRRHLVHRCIAWLPNNRAEPTDDIEVRSCASDASLRVDLSRPCTPRELAIFAEAVRAQRRTPLASTDTDGEWV